MLGGVLFFFLSFSDLTGDSGTLESGVSMEHPALVGGSGGSPTLVVVSVLYWELKRYWELNGYEVEPYPALKEVIYEL
jgi:hypothetical protein